MSLVCKTLVLVEGNEILKMILEAFPPPKYEMEFVDSFAEAVAHASSDHIDMFIVDSKFTDSQEMDFFKRNIPTMIVEQEYVERVSATDGSDSLDDVGFDRFEEINKLKSAADGVLRKHYINWIANALEYSPAGIYSNS